MSTEDQPVVSGLMGLVTAAVTPEEPSPPVPEALPAPLLPVPAAMPAGWDLPKVASLVTEVAQNIYELPYLLKKHDLTAEQYEILKNNEFFQRALEAEIITWRGANSIHKRLALETAIAVETALPTLAARLRKGTEPLADVTALLKVFSEIAGTIGVKAQASIGSGEKFKIVINLGGGEVTTKEVSVSQVQPKPEGDGTGETLSALVKTT